MSFDAPLLLERVREHCDTISAPSRQSVQNDRAYGLQTQVASDVMRGDDALLPNEDQKTADPDTRNKGASERFILDASKITVLARSNDENIVNLQQTGDKDQTIVLTSNGESKEYKEIRQEYQQNMTKLLSTAGSFKSKEELRNECENEQCKGHDVDSILTDCPCLQRIESILTVYHAMLQNEHLWTKVAMSPIIRFKGNGKDEPVYGHQQVIDDFYHVKLVHIDRDKKPLHEVNDAKEEEATQRMSTRASSAVSPQIAQKIYNQLSTKYPCIDSITELSKCKGFLRHYRDRTNRQQEQEMYHIVKGTGTDKQKQSAKTTEMRNEKEFIFQELLDSIHSYFLHSLMQYSSDGKAEPDDEKAIIDQTAQGRSFAMAAQENQIDAKTKPYLGQKEDGKWLIAFQRAREHPNYTETRGYSALVLNMGFFRWQSVHGFAGSESQNSPIKEGKFKNFKDEVLMNSFHAISKESWNQTLRKAKLFDASMAKSRIRTSSDGQYRDQMAGVAVKWRSNEIISLKEIICLKLYTDFDKLQFELKKCFRFEAQWRIINTLNRRSQADGAKDDEDSREFTDFEAQAKAHDDKARAELESRLREFWHWRSELLVIVHKYGQAISWKNNNAVLYLGVNQKMLFNPGEIHRVWGPLSVTSSYHTASSIATEKGMVLKVSAYYPRKDMCRVFDASLISDYPEEQEWIIGFMYVRVLEVKTRPTVHSPTDAQLWEKAPLSSQIRDMFFSVHLFKEQIFSMSEHLEFYLVHFLKCCQFECCEQSPFKSYDELKAEQKHKSFLSWMCCNVAQHEHALAKKDDFESTERSMDGDKTEIVRILWKRFWNDLSRPNRRQVIKIDTISDGLKKVFLVEDEQRDVYGQKRYHVSLSKVLQIFPNVQEIQFQNYYRFDNGVLDELLGILRGQSMEITHNQSSSAWSDPPRAMKQRKSPYHATKLQRVVFYYYDYVDATDVDGNSLGLEYPADGDSFLHPSGLDPGRTRELESKYKWKMKWGAAGTVGYKIEVQVKPQ